MARNCDGESARLDEAARAGWLYYVAGNTQDEIARKLGISRQAAQRLVSLAISERLIKVRLDHPIARCMELAAALKAALRPAVLRNRAERSGLELRRRSASRRSRRRNSSAGCAAPNRRSSASAPAAPCAQSPTNCRRWNARNTSWWRLSAPPRPTARPRSTTSSFASPTPCARRTIRCRCRSSRARSRNANS